MQGKGSVPKVWIGGGGGGARGSLGWFLLGKSCFWGPLGGRPSLTNHSAGGEEVPLLNHAGVAVAYIDRSEESTIYLWSGIPTAYLEGSSIYGFNGRHLGWFEKGMVWGNQGLKVGYTEETITSVGRIPRLPTVKGVKQVRPVPLPKMPAPPVPVFTDVPSPLTLGDLLRTGWP